MIHIRRERSRDGALWPLAPPERPGINVKRMAMN
jgi:hypothetical protein